MIPISLSLDQTLGRMLHPCPRFKSPESNEMTLDLLPNDLHSSNIQQTNIPRKKRLPGRHGGFPGSLRSSQHSSTRDFANSRFWIGSFEETVFRCQPQGRIVAFSADVSISRGHKVLHRFSVPLPAFLPHSELETCPWCSKIALPEPLSITKDSSVQVIIKDGRGVVGKIFLLRLNLQPLPVEGESIIRQKHYYRNLQQAAEYKDSPPLRHALQARVKRTIDAIRRVSKLDANGEATPAMVPREKLILHGSIRLVFSFNNSANIGICDGFDGPCKVNETLHIVTEEHRVLVASPLNPSKLDDNDSRSSDFGQIL